MTSRRAFLGGLAALTIPSPSWADAGNPVYLAAAKQGEGYFLHGLTETGKSRFAVPLPSRGHAAAAHPTLPLAVAFARRPGTFAVVINCATGTETAGLTPPEGRQFNGHGAFSLDGTILYTSEVIAETSEGRIGLWDTARFARIGEWSSGGIGPHDLKVASDGTLIVANGGIATDPNDRTKLNIATMRPNLAQLSTRGEALAQAEVPHLPQASIRHLALGPGGQVAFAMQWEGDSAETVPLLGLWTPGAVPVLCPAPEAEAPRMRGYAGSIARNAAGQIAITSPRGGIAQIFDATGTFLSTQPRNDICGLAPFGDDTFLASDGSGALMTISSQGITRLSQSEVQWDNHIVKL
ncbi:MAG: DUF1513 domain-containing protein [Paracoccaceae bacterium]